MAINQPENLNDVFYPVMRDSEPEHPPSVIFSESAEDNIAVNEESKWLDLGPR